jgi:DNA-binding response OmpR family regulator
MISSSFHGRVLLADDETEYVELLVELFARQGLEAVSVKDAAEGLRQLRDRPFDLLVSDIGMPGNTGLEFVREVQEEWPGMPVILLTGNPTIPTAQRALNLAVTGYLVKPPDLRELLELSRKAIANYRAVRYLQLQRQRLQNRLLELEQLEVALRKPPEAPGAAKPGDFLAAAMVNLQTAVNEFMEVAHLVSADENEREARRQANLIHALKRTVDVLERTRRNFKCVELRDLRLELENVLRIA